MKKKILFYQWKSVFHSQLEETKLLVPDCAKREIETFINDIHSYLDSIELQQVDETFLDSMFRPKKQ